MLFEALITFIQTHGYVIVFLLMAAEGPVVTYAAGLLSSFGYFNVWIIFVLSILGNLIPDMIFFKLGHKLRISSIEKFVAYFGLHEKRIKWLERNIKNHSIKTILFIKSVPPFPIPGILLLGFMKVKTKKFFLTSLIFNILAAAVCTSLGFYSGIAFNTSFRYFKLGGYILPIAVILVFIFYLIIKLVQSKAKKNLNKKLKV